MVMTGFDTGIMTANQCYDNVIIGRMGQRRA